MQWQPQSLVVVLPSEVVAQLQKLAARKRCSVENFAANLIVQYAKRFNLNREISAPERKREQVYQLLKERTYAGATQREVCRKLSIELGELNYIIRELSLVRFTPLMDSRQKRIILPEYWAELKKRRERAA